MGERVHLDPDQAANASTIAAVAASRGLPERAVTIALATAMQESELRNITHGDRDSVGLFQQRPSQGWGTERQILDPVYATNEFFDALEKVDGYSRLPLTVAAQKVQKSGFPQAYAKHETNASVLSAAMTGREPGALSCATRVPPEPVRGDAGAVAKRVAREFGTSVGSPARDGGTLRFTVDSGSVGQEQAQRAAALAAWAVAHARELHIERVARGGSAWTTEDSGEGWQGNSSKGATQVLITIAE